MEIENSGRMEENATIMVTKPRIVPPALTLGPEVNLLTEFALIATSPQSPLVREVSGENADTRRREDDSPPPQLVDPKKMDFQPSNWRQVSESISESPPQTTLQQEVPGAKWRCFMAGTKVNFPDEDNWTWRTVGDINMEDILADLFQDGLQVVDYERIGPKYNENSEECIVSFKSCNDQTSLHAEITADHPFFVKGTDRPSWASLNPAATELRYGISCQTLKMGDVCVLPRGSDVLGSSNGTQCEDEEKSSEFTAMDSTAALTLSSMAKDKEEHSHRRTKLLSESHCPSSPVKRNNTHQFTKRPMNAFMLFAKRFRVEITQAHPGKDNRAISVILGDKWKAMKQEDRREYVIQAKLLADEHKRVNPDCWKRKRNSEGSSKITYRRP